MRYDEAKNRYIFIASTQEYLVLLAGYHLFG